MVRDRLKKYKDLQAQHRILLNRFLSAGDPYANMAKNFNSNPPSSPTNKIISRMESELIKSDELIWEFSSVGREMQELDIALGALETLQRDIIKFKYIEKYRWSIVEDKVGYTEAHCKRIAKEGLIRIANVLYK